MRAETPKFNCTYCNKEFERCRRQAYKQIFMARQPFCSLSCYKLYKLTGKKFSCTQCGKECYRNIAEIKKNKTGHFFCSHSCNCKYHNEHKTSGFRRSKLEIFLEKELLKTFPNIEIIYNDRNIINSELDIYIPSLKLAFELNGIFHYEPIYGKEKLDTIQNNDKRKFQACLEKQIELCVIDTTSMKYFKIDKASKFLKIIIDLINNKAVRVGIAPTYEEKPLHS